jgi:hypothetical protein
MLPTGRGPSKGADDTLTRSNRSEPAAVTVVIAATDSLRRTAMSRPSLSRSVVLLRAVVLGAGIAATAQPLAAQQPAAPRSADEWLERCRRDDGWRDDRDRFCEVREYTVASTGRLHVDAGPNGGVAVHGWDRKDVFIRAKVQTQADSKEEAQDLAKELRVVTGSGTVRTEGPSSRRRRSWSVSYDIWAPRAMDLDLESTNGGVTITEVRGAQMS